MTPFEVKRKNNVLNYTNIVLLSAFPLFVYFSYEGLLWPTAFVISIFGIIYEYKEIKWKNTTPLFIQYENEIIIFEKPYRTLIIKLEDLANADRYNLMEKTLVLKDREISLKLKLLNENELLKFVQILNSL